MSPRQRRLRGSGTVYRDDTRDRWVGEVTVTSSDGSRVRRRVYADTSADAHAKLDRLRGVKQKRDTVHGYLRWYLDTYIPGQVDLGEISQRTAKSTANGLQHILDVTPAGLRLDQLDAEQLDRIRAALNSPTRDRRSKTPKPLAASTQARIIGQFSSALDVAVHYDLASVNRVRTLKRPKVRRKARPILTPAQAKLLLEDVKGSRLEPWYTVAVPAGLRRQEALGLVWGQVDLDAGRLWLTHQLVRVDGQWQRDPLKGRDEGEGREVSLAGFQVDVLRRHKVRQAEERLSYEGAWGNPWDLVIVDKGGTPVWGDRVWRDVVNRCERLGLPALTPHSFRRSAFSLLLAEGVDVATAMRMCGWQSSQVALEVYAQVTASGLDGVAGVLQELYGGET